MKKKLIFSGMILLALVLTGGTFAYTYSGVATATLDASLAGESITTHEPSEDQPDWDDILPEGEYYSEIILPSAAGDNTELPTQYPTSGEHWDKVCELPADDGETYVSTLSSRQWEKDLYNLSEFIGMDGGESILGVIVNFRFAAGGNYQVRAMAEIKTNGMAFSGTTEATTGTTFVDKSYQWAVNPATKEPWTVEEINNLQAGVTMRGDHRNRPAVCTQVHVIITYEYVMLEGQVPDGNLYDITPHPDYSGDLLVKVYLTNTGNLLRAYQYLNMKLYVEGSLEAEKTPNYQILSIENGVTFFNIEGESADSYTIEVTGGSYRLISGDPYEWGDDWSITPEFYCEVTQR
jgi:hypothetical protein